MQWWKDAVNSVYRDKPVKHPVIQALAQVWVAKTWPVLGLFSLTATQFIVESSQSLLTAGLCLVQVQAIHPLTRYRLQRLISTREEDLVGMHRMGSIAALEKYAEGTSSQLLYLQVLRIFSLTLTSHAASQQTLTQHNRKPKLRWSHQQSTSWPSYNLQESVAPVEVHGVATY